MPLPRTFPSTTCVEHLPNDWQKVGERYQLIKTCVYSLNEAQKDAYLAKLLAEKDKLQNSTPDSDRIDQIDAETDIITQL